MEITPKQEAIELIKDAKNILVVGHKNPDGDSLGSILALKMVLDHLGKNTTVASAEEPNQSFSFLPKINDLKSSLNTSSDLVISLNLENTDFEKLGYRKDKNKNQLEIIVSPKEGRFNEGDVSVKPASEKFDLIIVADTPNLERLGSLSQPTDLFYEVPVINIDHHPSNEKFGKVNWVELVATSTAEILVSLFEALAKDEQLINPDVATALLTGLIYDTSSFQNVNTTPKSLTVAAQLVAAGARQQEIVKNLYKTKSLETLRLWGLILSQVKEDKMHRFLWSSVNKEDIERTGAEESALSGVIDELLKTANDVDFAMLVSERGDQIHGSLRSIAKGFNVAQIAELFSGGGHESAAAFRIDGSLSAKEDEILSKIREFQGKNSSEGENHNTEKEIENVEEKGESDNSEDKKSSDNNSGESYKTKW